MSERSPRIEESAANTPPASGYDAMSASEKRHSTTVDEVAKSIGHLGAVYLDAGGMLAHEGSTSGLLLVVRQFLRRFSAHGVSIGVISAVGAESARWAEDGRLGLRKRQEASIPFFEFIVAAGCTRDLQWISSPIKAMLKAASPHLILMNSPAVFLDEMEVQYRRWANDSGATVVHIVADQLFPSSATHDQHLVSRIYQEMGKGTVLSLTERIQRRFRQVAGISSDLFMNPFDLSEVVVSGEPEPAGRRFVAMVNPHPIKGREVFDEVARRMPRTEFLIVRSWPDDGEYRHSSPNITVAGFFNRPTDLYRLVKILLVPSLHPEGLARVIIEAMLNRIPVIANRVGGLVEMGLENALFVSPPEVQGYDLHGTVLIPGLEEDSFAQCVSDYCQAIEFVKSFPRSVSERIDRAHRAAMRYVTESEVQMDQLVQTLAKP